MIIKNKLYIYDLLDEKYIMNQPIFIEKYNDYIYKTFYKSKSIIKEQVLYNNFKEILYFFYDPYSIKYEKYYNNIKIHESNFISKNISSQNIILFKFLNSFKINNKDYIYKGLNINWDCNGLLVNYKFF